MCREAIPLACRFRQREVLPEGTGIAQVIYLQFLTVPKKMPGRSTIRGSYENIETDMGAGCGYASLYITGICRHGEIRGR